MSTFLQLCTLSEKDEEFDTGYHKGLRKKLFDAGIETVDILSWDKPLGDDVNKVLINGNFQKIFGKEAVVCTSSRSKVIASPVRILELYLSGYDFSEIPKVIRAFSQLKSGEVKLISGVIFKKQGRDIVIVSVQRQRGEGVSKKLLFTLVEMLSRGQTAKSITTLKNA